MSVEICKKTIRQYAGKNYLIDGLDVIWAAWLKVRPPSSEHHNFWVGLAVSKKQEQFIDLWADRWSDVGSWDEEYAASLLNEIIDELSADFDMRNL